MFCYQFFNINPQTKEAGHAKFNDYSRETAARTETDRD